MRAYGSAARLWWNMMRNPIVPPIMVPTMRRTPLETVISTLQYTDSRAHFACTLLNICKHGMTYSIRMLCQARGFVLLVAELTACIQTRRA